MIGVAVSGFLAFRLAATTLEADSKNLSPEDKTVIMIDQKLESDTYYWER